MRISIVIPYHQTTNTAFFLSRALKSISEQSFKDYEIILTAEGLMAENINAAMEKAKGELIKILFMDDYFAHPNALQEISDNFQKQDTWLATGCLHQVGEMPPVNPHFPEYSIDIHKGNNKIGSPSVITLRNEGHLEFDERLSFLLDCDLYSRMYTHFGPPKVINDLNIIIGLHSNQVSNTMSPEEKLQEFNYLKEKHGN